MLHIRFLFPLIATIGAIFVALVISEFAARLLGVPAKGVHTVTTQEYQRIPGIFSPDQSLVVKDKPDLNYQVSIDSLGYRGIDFPREKPPGEWRIFMAGDSFTFGDYVNDNETLPSFVERRLRSRCSDGQIRVINAGLGGSTIVGQKELIRRGLSLNPDLVILTFSENDIDDVRAGPLYSRLRRNREAKSRFPISVAYRWGGNTALWHLLLKARAKFRALDKQGREPEPQMTEPDDGQQARPQRPYMTPAHRRYAQELQNLSGLLARYGIEFRLLLFPSHHSLQEPDADLTWVEGMATGSGLTVYNLRQVLRDSDHAVTELFLLPEDGHPSPLGYDIAARFVAEELAAGVLRKRCRGSAGKLGAARPSSLLRNGAQIADEAPPLVRLTSYCLRSRSAAFRARPANRHGLPGPGVAAV